MDKDKVKALAKLARIEITDREAERLTQEFEPILKYVGEVKQAKARENLKKEDFPLHNIMREDGSPHEASKYTQELLALVPEREGDYVKVKKILG